jgi:hypothetical protein
MSVLKKQPFSCLNLLFVFKSGREKSFPTSDFMKWIVKKMQNGGNDAKVKGVLLQPSSFWGENIGKICQCGIWVI